MADQDKELIRSTLVRNFKKFGIPEETAVKAVTSGSVPMYMFVDMPQHGLPGNEETHEGAFLQGLLCLGALQSNRGDAQGVRLHGTVRTRRIENGIACLTRSASAVVDSTRDHVVRGKRD